MLGQSKQNPIHLAHCMRTFVLMGPFVNAWAAQLSTIIILPHPISDLAILPFSRLYLRARSNCIQPCTSNNHVLSLPYVYLILLMRMCIHMHFSL
jgi:hypothetical protein